jgi:hypothetical protein
VANGQQTPTGSQQGTFTRSTETGSPGKTGPQPQAFKPNNEIPQAKNTQAHQGGSQPKTGLSREELALIAELAQDDHRVRAHEQAHVSAGGNLVRGGPNFEYQTGPDKQRYAVGGEVSIDTTPVNNDPQATIRKAEHIRRAALAPADPSSQDLRVAAEATHMELQAQAEERQAVLDKQKSASGTGSKTQTQSNPVLDAMIRKANSAALSKASDSNAKPVLGIFSA